MTTTQEQDTIYDVRVTAYDYIEADSPEEAIKIARKRLNAAGFDFDEAEPEPGTSNAILRTDLDVGTVYFRRGFRVKVAAE